MDMEILHNPLFWVSIAFILMVALSAKKVSVIVVNALDKRSARIRQELEQAKKLRLEAEQILADYKKKQAEYLKEAEHMLAKARRDAEAYNRQAEIELKETLDARLKQAMDKISQEETKAIDEVRNHIVDISIAAARSIIVEHIGNISQEDLVKVVIGDIAHKIH